VTVPSSIDTVSILTLSVEVTARVSRCRCWVPDLEVIAEPELIDFSSSPSEDSWIPPCLRGCLCPVPSAEPVDDSLLDSACRARTLLRLLLYHQQPRNDAIKPSTIDKTTPTMIGVRILSGNKDVVRKRQR
jgi:hypothetical protein